jgi:hypothetical protein
VRPEEAVSVAHFSIEYAMRDGDFVFFDEELRSPGRAVAESKLARSPL